MIDVFKLQSGELKDAEGNDSQLGLVQRGFSRPHAVNYVTGGSWPLKNFSLPVLYAASLSVEDLHISVLFASFSCILLLCVLTQR